MARRKRARSSFPPRPKPQVPPDDGVRASGSSATWWGARWMEALHEQGRDVSSRLARGRTYARAGRVHELQVVGSEVHARVQGTRSYRVTLTLDPLGPAKWQKVIALLAARAEFAAALLAGEMPRDVEDAFRAANARLFPGAEDLELTCNCPDLAHPCKHIAALHHVLAEAFDRDPFLLFELRGRPRKRLLDELRGARAVSAADTANEARAATRDALPCEPLDPTTYDAWRGGAPRLTIHPAPPARSGALLRQLGDPPSWRRHEPASAHLILAARAAAARAAELLETDEP